MNNVIRFTFYLKNFKLSKEVLKTMTSIFFHNFFLSEKHCIHWIVQKKGEEITCRKHNEIHSTAGSACSASYILHNSS